MVDLDKMDEFRKRAMNGGIGNDIWKLYYAWPEVAAEIRELRAMVVELLPLAERGVACCEPSCDEVVTAEWMIERLKHYPGAKLSIGCENEIVNCIGFDPKNGGRWIVIESGDISSRTESSAVLARAREVKR